MQGKILLTIILALFSFDSLGSIDPQASLEAPSYIQSEYEGTYYGSTFENKDYTACIKQADSIQKKIIASGLEVIESSCTSTLFKKWVVAVRYRYPHGRGIEEYTLPYQSMESCEAERSKVRDVLDFSEIQVIDLWCIKKNKQPSMRIDHIPHKQLRMETITVSNGQTNEAKCMNDAWALDKHLNDLGIQGIHYHCKKVLFGIDLDPSYRISVSFLNILGKKVSQIHAEKFPTLSSCQKDSDGKIKESFQSVKLDLLHIGCEKRGRTYHRVLYHLDDYLEKSQKYVGLNVQTRRDCETKLAELESLWEAQDRKTFYSFCQTTGSGYYPILYSIRKKLEIGSVSSYSF